MRAHALLLLCGLAGLLLDGTTLRAEPPRASFVRVGEEAVVQPGDAEAVGRLALRRFGKPAWLLSFHKILFIAPPGDRGCDVYLPPRTWRQRLRRGRLLEASVSWTTNRWELDATGGTYAQVALPGQTFGPRAGSPGRRDAPFEVRGKISDRDLIAIADLIRIARPAEIPPPEKSATRKSRNARGQEDILAVLRASVMDHSLPITVVAVQDANRASVATSSGLGSGERIKVYRKRGRWWIKEVWMSNA